MEFQASSKHNMELLLYSTALSCIQSRKLYIDGIAFKTDGNDVQ